MSKSKDEIKKSIVATVAYWISDPALWINNTSDYKKDLEGMIDECAKQEAIRFAEWAIEEKVTYYDNGLQKQENLKPWTHNNIQYTTDQLYSLYLESKNK